LSEDCHYVKNMNFFALQFDTYQSFTVAESLKMREIRNFNFFYKIEYLRNGLSYRNFERDQKCSELLSAPSGLGLHLFRIGWTWSQLA